MPEKDPSSWTLSTWSLALGMALGGGLINHLSRFKQVRRLKWFELLVDLLASALVGLGAFMLFAAFNYPEGVCAAASSVCGHMGTRLLFLVERTIEGRLKTGDKP